MSLIQAIKNVWSGLVVKDGTTPSQTVLQIHPQPFPTMNAVVRLPVLPKIDPSLLAEALQENETMLWKYMLRKLRDAITLDAPEAPLFIIEPEDNKVACVTRAEYINRLNDMIKHFIAVEEYESIPGCLQLIEQHKINDVIRV